MFLISKPIKRWSVWKDLNLRFSAPKADDLDRASLHTAETFFHHCNPLPYPLFM